MLGAKNGIEFGVFQPGEEDGIAGLLRTCFDSFEKYNLTGKKWLQYAEIDPGFRLDLSFVARRQGRVVGHVQLVERTINVRGKDMKIGGIANVSTLPEFRGMGISSTLMKIASQMAVQNGMPILVLFAGYGMPAHRIYRRDGYADTNFPAVASTTVFDIGPALKAQHEGVRVRNYMQGDEEQMIELYQKWFRDYACAVVRSREYFTTKFIKRYSLQSFFQLDFDASNVYIIEMGESTAGYALTYKLQAALPVLPFASDVGIMELVVDPTIKESQTFALLALLQRFNAEGLKSFDIMKPLHSPMNELFTEFRQRGVFMTKIIIPEEVARFITPSDWDEIKGSITFQGELYSFTIDGRKNVVYKGLGGEALIAMNERALHRFIVGTESMHSLLISGQAQVKSIGEYPTQEELASSLDRSLPAAEWFMALGDQW